MPAPSFATTKLPSLNAVEPQESALPSKAAVRGSTGNTIYRKAWQLRGKVRSVEDSVGAPEVDVRLSVPRAPSRSRQTRAPRREPSSSMSRSSSLSVGSPPRPPMLPLSRPGTGSQGIGCSNALAQLLLARPNGGLLPASTKESLEIQASAFDALVRSMESLKSPAEVVTLLLQDVVLCNEGGAFTPDLLAETIDRVLRADTAALAVCDDFRMAPPFRELHGVSAAVDTTELVAKVLKALEMHTGVSIGEIVGQILWRHRRVDVLQSRRFKKVAEDIEWSVTGDDSSKQDILQQVDAVFRELIAGEGSRMTSIHWRKVTRLIQANPILKTRMKATDADRLFYAETHQRGEARSGITRREFRSLLLHLASCMKVPPFMILLAVGCHNGHFEAGEVSQTLNLDAVPQYMRPTRPIDN